MSKLGKWHWHVQFGVLPPTMPPPPPIGRIEDMQDIIDIATELSKELEGVNVIEIDPNCELVTIKLHGDNGYINFHKNGKNQWAIKVKKQDFQTDDFEWEDPELFDKIKKALVERPDLEFKWKKKAPLWAMIFVWSAVSWLIISIIAAITFSIIAII